MTHVLAHDISASSYRLSLYPPRNERDGLLLSPLSSSSFFRVAIVSGPAWPYLALALSSMAASEEEDTHTRLGREAQHTAVKVGVIAMAVGSASAYAAHIALTRWSDVYRRGPAPLKRIIFALAMMGSFSAASHGSSAASTYTANDTLVKEMEERENARRTLH